jgi:hypothetical protein
VTTAPDAVVPAAVAGPPTVRRPLGGRGTLALAGSAYLGLAVVVTWGIWSGHPTSTTTCGCGDTSLITWFLEWPAYAIAHGLDPLYSSAMFHPSGVNLLDNTSSLGIGVVLAPVTWLFGPVATLNVALVLSPTLSALAMFALLRRWVGWAPAAFIGGLLYGFSPLVLVNLDDAHLMFGMLAIPPLVVGCLDELVIRQRRRPVRVGVLLGLLMVAQFSVGTELLLIMTITAVIGVAVLVVAAAVRHRGELARRFHHAAVGIGSGAAVAAVVLAYPTWFALDGPAHLSGLVWPTLMPGSDGIRLSSLVRLDTTAAQSQLAHRMGGYQGSGLHQADYLGVGLLVVVAIGMLVWRGDRRLWFFGGLGVVSIAMSLSLASTSHRLWLPWQYLRHVPEVQNILPERFMAMTFLCAGILLGLIIDHTHRWVIDSARRPARSHAHHRPVVARWRGMVGALASLGVAAVALGPIVYAYGGDVPATVRPVLVPTWFTAVAPHLPPGQVVLAYPSTFGGFQSSLTWQAVDRMSYSTVEGGGPGAVSQRAGREETATVALGSASLFLDPQTAYLSATVATVRRALLAWKVTRVVIPDPTHLPSYERGFHPSYAVGLITAALGQRPRMQADAWVWEPDSAIPPVMMTPATLQACVGAGHLHPGPQSVPGCVMAGGG